MKVIFLSLLLLALCSCNLLTVKNNLNPDRDLAHQEANLSFLGLSEYEPVTNLDGRRMYLTVTKDIHLPPQGYKTGENRTFAFNNGNLINQKLSRGYKDYSYTYPHCSFFTYGDRDLPSTIKKGTVLEVEIDASRPTQVSFKNINFKKRDYTTYDIYSVSCSFGYEKIGHNGSNSPVPIDSYKVKDFVSAFGGSVVVSVEPLANNELEQASHSAYNNTSRYPVQDRSFMPEIIFKKDVILKSKKREIIFQGGKIRDYELLDDSLYCKIGFKKSIAKSITIKKNYPFRPSNVYVVKNAILLEGNNYERYPKIEIQYIKCVSPTARNHRSISKEAIEYAIAGK